MKFDSKMPREEIIYEKRDYVAKSRIGFYDQWMKSVAPDYLNRPLPAIDQFPLKDETPNLPRLDSCEGS